MANREKCQAVLDYLLAHPEEHTQRWWGRAWDKIKSRRYKTSQQEFDLQVARRNYPQANVCGTTRCIAGTALWMDGRLTFDENGCELLDGVTASKRTYINAGAASLGLTREQAESLFMCMDNDTALHKLKEYANEA